MCAYVCFSFMHVRRDPLNCFSELTTHTRGVSRDLTGATDEVTVAHPCSPLPLTLGSLTVRYKRSEDHHQANHRVPSYAPFLCPHLEREPISFPALQRTYQEDVHYSI